jgi:hypothetical protein
LDFNATTTDGKISTYFGSIFALFNEYLHQTAENTDTAEIIANIKSHTKIADTVAEKFNIAPVETHFQNVMTINKTLNAHTPEIER